MTEQRRITSRFEPQREELDNGAVFVWNQNHDTASVALRGSLPAGAAFESPDHAGLASFTARLLRRGTHHHTASEIAARVEDIGASFAVWAGAEDVNFSVKCLGRDLGLVLEVLGEVLQAPAFPERELEKTREEVLTQLREQQDSTRARAELALYQMLYPGHHPYGRSSLGSPETVSTLSADDLHDFHGRQYTARGMLVSVAGDCDPDVVRRHVSTWFSGKEPAVEKAELSPVTYAGPRQERVSLPHKAQVDFILGVPSIRQNHPDYYALSMANLILGNLGLMGRLGDRVRDEQGLAYYVYSRLASRLWGGEWAALAGVDPANVQQALDGILTEVRRLREDLVTEQEFADARSYLIGSLPLRLETNDGVAGHLLSVEYYGLGLDYIFRYPDYIRAETRESLREAARKYLDPETFSVAMAGPV